MTKVYIVSGVLYVSKLKILTYIYKHFLYTVSGSHGVRYIVSYKSSAGSYSRVVWDGDILTTCKVTHDQSARMFEAGPAAVLSIFFIQFTNLYC